MIHFKFPTLFLIFAQKAVDMLLNNEDKISVSVLSFCQLFIKDLTDLQVLLIVFYLRSQIDRVVEELADRPELLHMVRLLTESQ